jgi:hypothetical protein
MSIAVKTPSSDANLYEYGIRKPEAHRVVTLNMMHFSKSLQHGASAAFVRTRHAWTAISKW